MKPSREQEVRHQNMLWYEELHNLLSLSKSNLLLFRKNESESEDEKKRIHSVPTHIIIPKLDVVKKGLQITKQYLY